MFIADDADLLKIATSKPTMTILKDDDGNIEEVPIPESFKNSDVVPEGYAIDHIFDPSVLLHSLSSQNITTVDQLSDDMLKEFKGIMNNPENVMLIPRSIYEEIETENRRRITGYG
ncbi:hypothetical protein GALMADRAFT_246377 [Galerina marginata CBS 339.88]|uniref:Uncharacterized protein n=1 Tax=Galerina marginata (strain CBS 339.88) TaxID=685588 RepID=A0A067TB74_GALM3|nr:hypothetical protein GALMADRAFT_246377 [Galerina marginata CBS 339.88]